jgi:hypothetical protein
MNRLTLRMKLGLGFGSLLLILAAMGFVANSSVGQSRRECHDQDLPRVAN